MPERAQVTSVETMETFRAQLIVYLSKARPALEEIADDVRQTQIWMENDRRAHWLNEARRRRRVWEEAQQALFSVRFASIGVSATAHEFAVSRAKRALDEAEEKLRRIRKWSRDYENLTAPLVKHIDQIHLLVTTDMRQAVAYLGRTLVALDAYVHGAASPQPAPPPAEASLAAPNSDPSPPEAPTPRPPHAKEGDPV